MPDLNEKIYAVVSGRVSAVDGVVHATGQIMGASAFLDTWLDLVRKVVNRITSPSATLTIGGSTGAVELTQGEALNGHSGVNGVYNGVPFHLSATGALSAGLLSNASTASTTIRKVLVTLALSQFPTGSTIASGGATLQFVYGSAYRVSAGIVSTGGASASFNLVPLPKPSAGEIPVGWLNIPNSFATSAAISAPMMIADYRELQGVNLSALMGTVVQP